MRTSDLLELSFSNLKKMKLRTLLTVFGVAIGIGALVSMISFGKGMQKNITDAFNAMELFNSITVLSGEANPPDSRSDPDEKPSRQERPAVAGPPLDDEVMKRIKGFDGVEGVFPEIRVPALVRFRGKEEFRLIQVLPASVMSSKLVKFASGGPFRSDNEESAVVSSSFLHGLGFKEPGSVVGEKIVIMTIALNSADLNPLSLVSALQAGKLPFSRETYEFSIAGVTESMGFGGPSPVQSDVFLPAGTGQKIKKLPFTNIWDIFRSQDGRVGYSALNVRLASPRFVDPVKNEVEKMGYRTFALLDQIKEIRASFLYMDMILAAVGMIAIVVASLGIINTMVMSILERTHEIGVMKAVGAKNLDIEAIFFCESGAIGFLGGLAGLALGWSVSGLINRVVNYFLARQGVPHMNYFNFPWWLLGGAVLFAVLVSLASGVYPALRAARVDPVRALRHE